MTPVVLVHGGGCGAWCWDPLLPLLRAPAIAPDLPPESMRGGPGRFDVPVGADELTIADWARAVLTAADRAGYDRFVLVGHSLGGITLTEVARVAPDRVAHLVFVSAMVPPEGQNTVDALPPEMIERVSSGLTEAVKREMFCNDLDDEQTRLMLDRFGNELIQIIVEPVTRAGLPETMAKTYVRLRRDQGLPPAAQDASIAALGAGVDIVELDTGHMVMISRPDLLAPLIDRIAESS